MRHLLFPLAALFVFSVSSVTLAQESASAAPLDDVAVRSIMEKAVDGFIRPAYRDFLTSAGRLESDMYALCTAPSAQTLATAKQAFDKTAWSWGRIEIVRVGPVIQENRFERILYYPDRKSIGIKQVQGLLAQPEENATTPEGLAGKSVAIQGLTALEFVLFGTGAEALQSEANSYRCRYGAAVAASIRDMAGDLVEAWEAPDGVQNDWKNPGPDNPAFRDSGEAMTELLGVLVHGAEAVRDQRIETFYKGNGKTPFPKQALFWRSGNTWKIVLANLDGLSAILNASGMGDLLKPGQRSMITSIDTVIADMTTKAGSLSPDIEAVFADEKQKAVVDDLLKTGKDLIYKLNDDYGSAIGMNAGFSFADGD